eukprot:COSAG06_NODE_54187_length_296_cov_0.431472_1_plen_38_part_01
MMLQFSAEFFDIFGWHFHGIFDIFAYRVTSDKVPRYMY